MHFALDARTLTMRFPGIGRYVRNLLQAIPPLLNKGESLTALVPPNIVLPEGIQACEISDSPLSLRQHWSVPRALRKLKPDVYHNPYHIMPFRPRFPCVLTVHDLIPMKFPEHSRTRARLTFRTMLGRALKGSTSVITVSQQTRADLCAAFKIKAEKISCIHSAPDSIFQPQPAHACEAIRNQYGLSQHFVLCVSSARPHKNLATLLKAWNGFLREGNGEGKMDWMLVLSGPNTDTDPGLLQLQAESQSPESIKLLGVLPDSEMPSLYSAASQFVLPSLYEGFGFPVLEAMACGTPVACSRAGSLPEVCGEAAYYFQPEAEDLLKGLRHLLSDPKERRRLAQCGLQKAGEYSWEKAAGATLNIYRNAVLRTTTEI